MTRRCAIPMVLLAVLLAAVPAKAEAAGAHRKTLATCQAGHGHIIAADSQAEVYEIKQGQELVYRGCVYGKRRSFVVGGPVVCGGGSSGSCGGTSHFVLAGEFVAYEEVTIEEKYGTPPEDEWIVVVRDLSNGHTIHRLPTGSALRPPSPHYIGVGKVVALALKSNGSAAWIANDYERAVGVGTLQESQYFDVWAVDRAGARQLAGGTDVDPSSLALAVGATEVGREGHNLEGTSAFWTQAGKPFSAPLN